MRKLLRYLGAGKREQLESDFKEITPADRVRALRAKREQDESGPKEITPADRVRAADERAQALEQKSPAEEPVPARGRPLTAPPVPAHSVEEPPTPRPEHEENTSEESSTTDAAMMGKTDWEDLKVFIGPNAEEFRSVWTKRNEKGVGTGWCWPAFFFAFAWFFYRKMYQVGAILLLLPIIIALILPDSDAPVGLLLGVVYATLAKDWYLQTATKKIEKISQRTSSNETKRQQLQIAGGVSVAGGVIGGAIYAVAVGVVFLAAAGEA